MKPLTILPILLLAAATSQAQYISEVLEYVPAPSQYMNAAPWGNPNAAFSVVGGVNGHLSLGAFGGYVVFRFENPVENDPANPFGVDFTVFGNPLPNWSEPGIVSVMKDDNGNGLPDDTWYELAGSDHFFSSTIRKYEVTYSNPNATTAADVPWSDNQGNAGFIKANSYFLQPYYPLPDSFSFINNNSYTLSGTRIKSTVDAGFPAGVFSQKRSFGYADNQFKGTPPYTLPDNPYTPEVENSGGDAFDISWAIDSAGNYVELTEIHFVKVHTGVMDGAGWLGQISTEIMGAVDVEPATTPPQISEILVIKEMPFLLDTSVYQLEVFVFSNGKLLPDQPISWSSNMPDAVVDDNHILHVSESGELVLTAILNTNQEVTSTVTTTIDLSTTTLQTSEEKNKMALYPNPANDFISFEGGDNCTLTFFTLTGRIARRFEQVTNYESLDISALPQGFYIVEIASENEIYTEKLIKR